MASSDGDGRGGVARAAGEQFPAEAAAFVDLEKIDGDVLGAEAQGLVEGVAPACGGLIRQAGDEVQADVGEAFGTKTGDGGEDVVAAVHAAGGLEFGVVKGLRAEADAIDAGGEPGGGLFPGDGFGIGLERRLRAGRTGSEGRRSQIGRAKLRVHGVEDAGEVGGIEEAGRAAAEVDGVGGYFFRLLKSRSLTAVQNAAGIRDDS